MSSVKFKISSALKTILGKELITDDFIAVFELVKNSFDAHARRVDITFEGLTTNAPKIVIVDNGDGMDDADLTDKWLFVAYSAKKKNDSDYRDKITSNRIFAGAKGIGRFSCDRLGEKVTLYTRKRGETGDWHVLTVEWSKFEADAEKEFQTVPAEYSTQRSIDFDIEHGTVVEITDLREHDWDRDKLLRLRRSLERLVNPNQENDSSNFKIFLHAPDEAGKDQELKRAASKAGVPIEPWNLVNGAIRNFLFEALELKTARVAVEVGSPENEDSTAGSTIRTRLEDRGTLIYELVERNPFSTLHDIRIHLFALNQSARLTFTKRMGMRARDYGSVFLYKNGFRIHPFGDPGDDNLGIDNRHQQGVWRTLGTRDLSGRVEVNGRNPNFQETSSRDGGLIRNQAYYDLKDLVIEYALKRLEKFVIDLAKFGPDRGELPEPSMLSKSEVQQKIFDMLVKLTQSKDVIELHYDPEFLKIVRNKSSESVSALLANLKRLAAEQKTPDIAEEVQKAERQLRRLARAKEDAEAAEERERERAKQAEEKARAAQAKAEQAEEKARSAEAAAQEARLQQQDLDTQNVFLKAALSKDLEHVIKLHHSIGQDATTIQNYVTNLLDLLASGSTIPPEKIRVPLQRISYVATKISAVSRMATQASKDATEEELTSDVIQYIREYLLNVYRGSVLDINRNLIPVRFHQPPEAKFVTTFYPINVSIVFDSLISNARKHKVRKVDVTVVEATDKRLVISFADEGPGIPKKNLARIFDLGFTTTDGSGLGLHHVRQIMDDMGGRVDVNPDREHGAEFLLTFEKP